MSQNPDTVAVTAGRPVGDRVPLNEPIVLASNFTNSTFYSRCEGTNNWRALEDAVGKLEGAKHCVAFASGMAAASAVLFASKPTVLILPRVAYHGVRALVAENAHIAVRPVDTEKTAQIVAALPGASMLWLETPSNPMLDVADLSAVVPVAVAAGVPVVVDATFATPVSPIKPLALGATMVMHSGTKFIGGHSDLLIGLVATNDAAVYERLLVARSEQGATPGALESFLALRGLRTLPLRFAHASASAKVLAARLAQHAAVQSVRYPNCGAMVSFIVRGGAGPADAVVAAAQLVLRCTSLGGVETTFERRAQYAGDSHIDPGLLRMSVGLEAVEDLWADLQQALDRGLAVQRILHIPKESCATQFRPLPPVARVASGALVAFETNDSNYERLSRGAPLQRCDEDPDAPSTWAVSLETINVMTGPLWIEDAQPGDALRIEVVDVSIRRCWSVWDADESCGCCLAAKRAALSGTASVRELAIDQQRQRVRVSERLTVPLRPMIGCMATASPDARHWSTLEPTYPTGGNMDLRELQKGATIVLPVACEGGLLYVGDLHAAMGQGEPVQVGFEAAGTATLRVHLVKGGALPFPRLFVDDSIIFTAVSATNHVAAMQTALGHAYDYLVSDKGLTPEEAYGMLTAHGDARFGGPASKQALIVVPAEPSAFFDK